ncbi:MAG: hypothetical protein C0176_01085 [Mesoaciditoga sp.]|mgnify:CR=1 FL=1|uniref:hypothetical protein n=1 Tax=Athalassotoga sp. TaxID=2022597 RepID=UPI000CBCEE16|nr:MAG: hypothetical protein C0185_00640 [Mesoaciditoga sp.]PMP80673.1 MAG: hypothetical protein C0176_01085 [Mesoaciditoga sp.]HEU24125.1 hypothetical protein [Mesoaciditoga lauensis]
MKILVDDSVDVEGIEKIPLYIDWKGRKIRVSDIDRPSYFALNKKSVISLPTYDEINRIVSRYIPVTVLLPSRSFSFLKDELNFLSSLSEGITLIEERMDSVALSLFLNSGKPLSEDKKFAQRATTYLLFSDLSFLRKNDVISEKKESVILTKMINVVKLGFGRTIVKSMWSLKSAVSMIMTDIKGTPSMIAFRYSGKKKIVDSIVKEFSEKFNSNISTGWMNPVLASLYGHDTLTITVILEDNNGQNN